MYHLLFSLSSLAVLFWVLLILLPSWKVTRFLAQLHIFPVFLAILYSVGIITAISTKGLGFIQHFNSASGVIQLLSESDFALLVWIHILCFDQVVGHSIYRDNMENRYIQLPLQSILLFLTLMFGPFGWLCYVMFKKIGGHERERSKENI
ncbi:ABA4-like family protein [Pseudalkalibacillus sp. A8]|uniref:ABA4-like family protein n=1 Tax=Pseudalkalibacillus sp. A8 TaxID=3382641 RepID=UPI0038B52DC7